MLSKSREQNQINTHIYIIYIPKLKINKYKKLTAGRQTQLTAVHVLIRYKKLSALLGCRLLPYVLELFQDRENISIDN